MSTGVIATDAELPAAARGLLARVLDAMIPPSAEYDVPGGGDELILDDVLRTGAALVPVLTDALAHVDADADDLLACLPPDLVPALIGLLAQCYYRDDRVMRSLDMEPRPPFPGGFEVEDGDWNLLDPVRARAPFYRRVDPDE